MDLDAVVEELVEERSLDALERLTGSRKDEVLEALIEAAGRLIEDDRAEETDDGIVESIRSHLVECRPVGLLIDALSSRDATVREFALACLGEIGDPAAVSAMVHLLEDKDSSIREAASEHLALLTHYDLGPDPAKWREWLSKRARGEEEQAKEDQEDAARRLRLQHRGRRGGRGRDEDEGAGPDDDRVQARAGRDEDEDEPRGRGVRDDDDDRGDDDGDRGFYGRGRHDD